MKRARVVRILYLVNSWVVKTSPFVAKLQMALLNIFRVNSSSIKEQFSIREVLSESIMLYLLTKRPWREKFSQMTDSMAKISRLREDFSSSSQSIRKTVTRNFLVNGKQNLGFSLMSSAMIDSTYIIRNSVCGCCSSDSKQENVYFEVLAKRGEVVHHPPHEVDMGHENGCVSLLEEMVHAKQALLKLSPLGLLHGVGQLLHGLFCLGLLGSISDVVDEKLQRRFLEDDREVRGLRLSGSRRCHCCCQYGDGRTKNNYRKIRKIILLFNLRKGDGIEITLSQFWGFSSFLMWLGSINQEEWGFRKDCRE